MDQSGKMENTLHPPDKRIMTIAAEVSNVADNVVPRVLIKLQAILDSFPQGSLPLMKLRQDIWALGLTQVMLTALKQDYSKILDGWNMGCKVAAIFCQSCVGLEPTDSETYNAVFMPDAIQTLLMLCRKLQMKHMKTSNILEDTKRDILKHLKTVADSISLLCSGPDTLAKQVLQSPWLLQMLITDDTGSSTQIMSLIQSLNRMKFGIYGTLEEKIRHQILDELTYKLSSSKKNELASAACRTIIGICESHPPVVELLCERYRNWLPKQTSENNSSRGLQHLLKDWHGSGFDRDVYRLEQLLEAGSLRQAELQKKHEAAMIIQAVWRSHHTRKKIKKAGMAMASFQRTFRARRRRQEEAAQDARIQAQLQHMLLMKRRKAMRDLRGRQLEALNILPAGEVEKFLQQEQHQSATHIQRLWRGHRVRQGIKQRADIVHTTRAVVVIQRSVRRWLERVRTKRREPPAYQRPPGLTDERRVQLQQVIMERRENKEVETTTKEAREELHFRTQELIKQFAMSSRATRKKHQSRELLLARLESDAELLMEAPKLSDIVESDIDIFTSRSVPIATKARYNHTQELRLLRQPWWRKLGDEYQDKQTEEESDMWKVF